MKSKQTKMYTVLSTQIDKYISIASSKKVIAIHMPISNVRQYLFTHTMASNGAYCLFLILIIISISF